MNPISIHKDESDISATSRKNLQHLLNQIIDYPDQRAEITERIEQTFGDHKAILVLDMSGFSRTTQKFGIIAFLLMIHQMQLISKPCIEKNGGTLIKAEADNLFCLFNTVEDAVTASQEINDRLNAANAVLPADQHLYASFGIGYGKILNIGSEDIFGDEVNLASKLGEDIAGKTEILLSSSARATLAASDIKMREETVSISGISLTYYTIGK